MKPLGVTPDTAKAMIGCGTTKLYELLNAGQLESYHIGRARRITTASIEALVSNLVQQGRMIHVRHWNGERYP